MSTRFDRSSGLVRVRTHLWRPSRDIALVMAVDTGASRTVINQGRLAYVGYDLAAVRECTQTVSASAIEFVPRVRVIRLAALGVEHRGITVLAHTLPPALGIDGLIGLDFLRNHRLTIDFNEGIIDLA